MRTGSITGTRAAVESFRRRPCFWWAAALVLGFSLLPAAVMVRGWLWAYLAASAALIAMGRFPVGSCLLAFAIGGGLSAHLNEPAASSRLQAGRGVTLRGTVEQVLPGTGDHRQIVLRTEARLTTSGWQPEVARLGVDAPPSVRVEDRVQVSGLLQAPLPAVNPGGFDARRFWLTHGVSLRLAPHERGYRRLATPTSWSLAAIGQQVRSWVQATNRRTLPSRAAAIADSFLIGAGEGNDPEILEDLGQTFRSAGTIHLLVVSGTQVGAVLGLFVLVGKRLWRLRLPVWLTGVCVLAVYYAATGGDASITRAAVFGGLVVLALVLMREIDGENTLGLTLLLLVAFQPALLLDLGAQLSFAAVWGLVRLAPALAEAGPAQKRPGSVTGAVRREPMTWKHALKLAFCANVAAHLATAPILAYHFQTSCWAALLSNLAVFPIASLLLPFAFLHLVFSQVGWECLAPVVTALASGLDSWSQLFGPPLGARPVFPPHLWLLPVFFGLIGLTAQLPARVRWHGVGVLVAVLLISERLPAPAPGVPTLRAIDVGQGDAVLLQGRDGTNVLVDAGPPPTRPDRLPLAQALRGLRVGKLDAVVVSHAHADHMGGLPQLLQEFHVGTLVCSPRIQHTPLWKDVLEVAVLRGVRLMEVSAGDRVSVGRTQLEVLAPDSRSVTVNEDPNEESLVVRWEAGGKRVLLTGDAGFPTEASLLSRPGDLHADVLKVGHHGSSRSTSEELLARVQPGHALISCGRQNRFGHPHTPALARLKSAGIPVSRTDEGGMVTLRLEWNSVVSERYLPAASAP